MARIKLQMPEKYIFTTVQQVRITDLNYGNHLGNDSMLAFIHEARVQFLESLGYSELDIEGSGLIMSDSAIVYKGEGFYGDQLEIQIAVKHISNHGFDLFYLVKNQQSGKTLAEAKTGMICFDYKLRKINRIPEKFKEKIDLKDKNSLPL